MAGCSAERNCWSFVHSISERIIIVLIHYSLLQYRTTPSNFSTSQLVNSLPPPTIPLRSPRRPLRESALPQQPLLPHDHYDHTLRHHTIILNHL